MTNEKLMDAVRTLKLEVQKIELENRLAQLKAEPIIDEGCVGCCKVVDVAARLQEALEDTETKLVGCRRLIDYRDHIIREMDVTISDLMDNDQRINGFLDEYRVTVDNRDKTIGELQDRNAEELYKLYSLDNEEIDRLKDELSARKHDSEVLMEVVDIIKDDTIPNSKVPCMIYQLVDAYIDAPEGPPETPIDEKVCVFCGCKNPSIQVGVDWFCSMRCVDGQADVNKHIHDIDGPQEITVTVAFLELL